MFMSEVDTSMQGLLPAPGCLKQAVTVRCHLHKVATLTETEH